MAFEWGRCGNWRACLAGLLLLAATGVSGGAAVAADQAVTDPAAFSLAPEPKLMSNGPASADDWHFVTRLGLWAISLDGTVDVRDTSSDFGMGFDDVLEDLNFAFMPAVEVYKGRWGLVFNGVFAQLEGDEDFSRTLPGGGRLEGGADVTMDMYIADLGIAYRLFDIPLREHDETNMVLTVMPAVGVRYTYIDIEVNPDRFESRSIDQELWDPYVGGRLNLQISEQLAWRTEAEIGGFGVGSDLTWAAQTFLDWRLNQHLEVNIGYRAMYYDYEDGDFELDLTMHGPWIGMSFHLQ